MPALLIGDFNMNGITDYAPGEDGILGTADDVALEDTIFISLEDAQFLVNSKNKGDFGEAFKLGRDVVATWLNFLAGNNINATSGDADNIANAPALYIDEAVAWLQEYSSVAMDASVDCTVFAWDDPIASKDGEWHDPQVGNQWSAAEIHEALDSYNNDGMINGESYAGDADSLAFAAAVEQIVKSDFSFFDYSHQYEAAPTFESIGPGG